LFLICNLNLNYFFDNNSNKGEVKVEEVNNEKIGKRVIDNELKIFDEFKNDNSSISEISKSLNIIKGNIDIEGIVEKKADIS